METQIPQKDPSNFVAQMLLPSREKGSNMTDTNDSTRGTNANRDPLTKAPGAHPAGTGVGAAVGTAAGAAIGAMGGPATSAAGAAIGGAVVGGVAGGLAGKAAAERIDPTVEDTYWAKAYVTMSYVPAGSDYRTYRPAYRYGWESYPKYAGRMFDEVEPQLARDWESHRGSSNLSWSQAKAAVRDAWHRVEHALPGHSKKDAR